MTEGRLAPGSSTDRPDRRPSAQAVEAVIGRLREDPIADFKCGKNQLEVFFVDEPVTPGSVAVIPAAVPIVEIDLNTMQPLGTPQRPFQYPGRRP